MTKSDKPQTIRLDRLLANLGYGSRKSVTKIIRAGDVTLNGEAITSEKTAIDTADIRAGLLCLDGEPLDPPAPMTVMLNKPVGYTSSHNDAGPIVFDLLPQRWHLRKPALSIAGRLDKDSSGMLLLTDDGQLLHKIISPAKPERNKEGRAHIQKHYRVQLSDTLKGNEADMFAAGDLMLGGEDKPLLPAHWTQNGEHEGVMILSEGRNRQIRRMFESLGNEVISLHRFQTGDLSLGTLPEGEWRILSEDEVKKVIHHLPEC